MVSLIVATGLNRGIGKENKLLWHLPDDLKYFKNKTLDKPIIMGRSTFDSVGRPLPKRRNIVITRNPDLEIPGVDIVHSLNDAIQLVENQPEIMIVGGAEIYNLALPLADRVYLTLVDASPEADRFFPNLPSGEWELTDETIHSADENHFAEMKFQVWNRISNG
jgi:dihydrofolate reductase